MGEDDIHPLRAWRLRQTPKLTQDAAAAEVGTVRQVWRDWEIGRRIPERSFMIGIYRLTRGVITPNDFYDLPPIGQLELPMVPPPPAPLFDEAAEPQAAAPELQAAA